MIKIRDFTQRTRRTVDGGSEFAFENSDWIEIKIVIIPHCAEFAILQLTAYEYTRKQSVVVGSRGLRAVHANSVRRECSLLYNYENLAKIARLKSLNSCERIIHIFTPVLLFKFQMHFCITYTNNL